MPPHRVVIVGVGSIGERHVRCFQATARAEVAIVEINAALRSAVAERYQVPAFDSLPAALDWRPTAAVIAAPAPAHIPLARQCVSAGAHVLIEKPLSTSLDGTVELIRSAAEAQRTAGVAYVLRAFPAAQALKQALDSGRFGRPLQITAVCGQHFPTYRPAYRDIYYARRETGGGAIQDALTHIINAGEWLTGPVTALVADAAHCALAGVEVEDTVHLLARHGQVLGSYALNQHQAPNEMTLTVVCERGTLRWEHHRNHWQWMSEPGGEWASEPFGTMDRDAPFIAQAHAFLDATEGKRTVLCSLEEGLQTLRVNLAALASVEGRCWQAVG